MGRRRNIFDVPGGPSVQGAAATVPPTLPPIRWDYETPRPPDAVQRRGAVDLPSGPRRAPRTRWLPLISAAFGGAALAMGCTLLLLAMWWLLPS